MVIRYLLATAVLLAAATSTVHAEWLVTVDGQTIETAGAWKMRSKTVHFTLPDGTYSVLPRSTFDLAASREMTRAKRVVTASAPVPEAPRVSVLRITDADVSHVDDSATPPSGGTAAPPTQANGAEPGSVPASERLRVIEWKPVSADASENFVVEGTFQNVSRQVTGNIQLSAVVFDPDGAAAEVTAKVSASTLTPGQKGRFRAEFESIYEYERVEFSFISDAIEFAPR